MQYRRPILTAVLFLFVSGSVLAADGALQFRLGAFAPTAGGDFWTETGETFDLERADLRSAAIGFSFVAGFSEHLEVGFNLDYASATASNGYRDYADGLGYPILHDTRLRTMPLTADLRILPIGRSAGNGKAVFYLGAGIGTVLYDYEESGDFIDFSHPDWPVVYDRYADSGAALETHALAGLELPFGRNWGMLFEVKYSWAEAELGGAFAEMGSIDLGGPSGYVGMSLRF